MATQVSVHYRGTLDDGTQFDCSYDRNEPITFVEGAHQVIPGFEKTVAEMQPGDKKTARFEPKDAYGESNPAMMMHAKVGQKLYVFMGNRPVPVTIKSAENGEVVLDANHELAGQALNFNIELVEVED